MVLANTARYNVRMIPTLSDELQHALDQSGGRPLRVEDPRTRKAYALVEWDVARTWIETHRVVDGDWSENEENSRADPILLIGASQKFRTTENAVIAFHTVENDLLRVLAVGHEPFFKRA